MRHYYAATDITIDYFRHYYFAETYRRQRFHATPLLLLDAITLAAMLPLITLFMLLIFDITSAILRCFYCHIQRHDAAYFATLYFSDAINIYLPATMIGYAA